MPENILSVTPPLQQAICEVRFPGDPEVELTRAAFYRNIKNEFPSLYVPNFNDGQAVALQPYQFVSPDDRRLGVAVHSFFYSVTGGTYESFSVFKNSFQNYLSRFMDVYSYLEGFTRISLRYINHLPMRRGVEGEISYMPLKLPMAIEAQLRDTLRIAEYQHDGGIIRAIVDTTNIELAPDNLALLDFDFSYRTDGTNLFPIGDVETKLDKAHEAVKNSLKTFVDAEYAEEVGISWP